jgi:hypothetical protein
VAAPAAEWAAEVAHPVVAAPPGACLEAVETWAVHPAAEWAAEAARPAAWEDRPPAAEAARPVAE